MKLPPEDIAYPRSVNGLKKFSSSNGMFAKGAPIHCKGAILYNHLVKKHKMSNKYPIIQEGDKIKFLHMKQPNIYTSSAFSFLTSFPKELDIIDRIDYDEQYTRRYCGKLMTVMEHKER